MSFSGYSRRFIYYLKDFLFNKSKNRKMFNNIQFINNHKKEGQIFVEKQLQKLLEHSSSTTEFYKKYKCKKLCDYPVINKEIILANKKQISSSKFDESLGIKLIERTTSGSTGIPFSIKQNIDKRERVIAELKAMFDMVGYKSHEKMLSLVGSEKLYPCKISQEVCENIYRIGITKHDEKTIKAIVDFLIKKKPVALHGSACNLPPIIKYIQAHNYEPSDFNLKVIITGGEMVPDSLKQELKNVFGSKCNICIKYSNEEMGILAINNGIDDYYKLNVANYYFEILELESDTPCDVGKLGRIVITDLFNFANPLIRYDTGDIGMLIYKNKNNWPVLVNLSGKIRDLIYDTQGIPISASIITNTLKHLTGVKQWQLIQKDKINYVLKYISLSGEDKKDSELMVDQLKEIIGGDSKIYVERVDKIENFKSGKTRYTVNLYKDFL